MLTREAVEHYRPVRTTDAEGGYTEALGAATIIYGEVIIHNGQVTLDGVDIYEDIRVGDIIVVKEV